MVGSAFVEHAGLDPIAHHESLGGALRLWNKTGTDAGVRADVGVVSRGTSVHRVGGSRQLGTGHAHPFRHAVTGRRRRRARVGDVGPAPG